MSYLLDALKKSELERKIGDVPSLSTELIFPEKAQKPIWRTVAIALLLTLNVITVIYFAFFQKSTPENNELIPTQSEPIRTETVVNQTKPEEKPLRQNTDTFKFDSSISAPKPSLTELPVVVPEKATTLDTKSEKPTPVIASAPSKKTAQESGSITKPQNTKTSPTTIVTKHSKSRDTAVRKKSSTPKPRVATRHRVNPKKDHKTNTPKIIQSKKEPTKPRNDRLKTKPTIVTLENTAIKPKKPATATVAKKTTAIPFLSHLPRDFQREVSDVNINVFVYSEAPKERFVIIDMVKYTPGQPLPSGAVLKDIDSDSIILDYRNQVFRIKRP